MMLYGFGYCKSCLTFYLHTAAQEKDLLAMSGHYKSCLIVCFLFTLQHNKESIGKLSKLPDIQSHVNENVLNNVNKLRERLSQSQNAVIIDDQVNIICVANLFSKNSSNHL